MNTQREAHGETVQHDRFTVVQILREYPFHTACVGWDVYLDGERVLAPSGEPYTRFSSLQMACNVIDAGGIV